MNTIKLNTIGILSGGGNAGGGGGGVTVEPDYLSFFALEDGLTFSLSTYPLEYRIEYGDWKALPANTTSESINAGARIYIRGSIAPSAALTFSVSKKFSAEGNPASLIYGDNVKDDLDLPAKAFCRLFQDCTTLMDASNMHMRYGQVGQEAFAYIFFGCSNLRKAPNEIYTKTLSSKCYRAAFYGCENLNASPKLISASTNAAQFSNPFDICFSGCTNLSYIYNLCGNGAVQSTGWVSGVSPTGIIVRNKANGSSYNPSGWEVLYV